MVDFFIRPPKKKLLFWGIGLIRPLHGKILETPVLGAARFAFGPVVSLVCNIHA